MKIYVTVMWKSTESPYIETSESDCREVVYVGIDESNAFDFKPEIEEFEYEFGKVTTETGYEVETWENGKCIWVREVI